MIYIIFVTILFFILILKLMLFLFQVFSKLVITITKNFVLLFFFLFLSTLLTQNEEKTIKRAKGIVIVILIEKTSLALMN